MKNESHENLTKSNGMTDYYGQPLAIKMIKFLSRPCGFCGTPISRNRRSGLCIECEESGEKKMSWY